MIDKPSMDSKLLETLLTKQLEVEIGNHIRKLVQPKIDTFIKELAGEAVKNWVTKIQTSSSPTDPFNQMLQVQVNFVENIIRTEVIKSDAEIIVNKSKSSDEWF